VTLSSERNFLRRIHFWNMKGKHCWGYGPKTFLIIRIRNNLLWIHKKQKKS
jgi:hypothetical protein